MNEKVKGFTKGSQYHFDLLGDLDSPIDGSIEITIYRGSPAPESRNPSSPQFSIPPEEDLMDYDMFITVGEKQFKLPNDLSEEIFSVIQEKVAQKIFKEMESSNDY